MGGVVTRAETSRLSILAARIDNLVSAAIGRASGGGLKCSSPVYLVEKDTSAITKREADARTD